MAYSTGMLNRRVAIMARKDAETQSDYGSNSAGHDYEYVGEVWAAVDYNKGQKSLREGAYDAYDYLMIRMRYTKLIDRWCMIVWDNRTFEIEKFDSDKYLNQIQLLVREVPGNDMTALFPHILATCDGEAILSNDDFLFVVTAKREPQN